MVIVKCVNCKKDQATAWINGKRVCFRCFEKLKISKRVGNVSIRSWWDKYIK